MSHLSNYPAGAMYDPSAPFAQPTASDDCCFAHPEYEECDGVAINNCRECSVAMCEVASVGDYCIECFAINKGVEQRKVAA